MNYKPEQQHTAQWLADHYAIDGQLTPLVGDVDFNFHCQNNSKTYTVKVSFVQSIESFDFEDKLLSHLANELPENILLPTPILNHHGQWLTVCDQVGTGAIVMRVLSWVNGDLFSGYKPHSSALLNHLGQQAAKLDQSLKTFDHPKASRTLSWDLSQSLWIKAKLDLFDQTQTDTLQHFIILFETQQTEYQKLPQQVIHNDLNDNNILVSQGQISGFIDFGDAIKTQLINEVAVLCAYAMMNHNDPLSAATDVISGYHQINLLTENELAHLYHLIGMRLAISVTHSAIARQENPDNAYKTISEQAAWELLNKWQAIPVQMADYSFLKVCEYPAHPKLETVKAYLKSQAVGLADLFPEHDCKANIHEVDLSVGSTLLGCAAEYENHTLQQFKLAQLQKQHPEHFLAGGYGEARSFYASDAFSFEGNSGKEYRTIHLGLDIWVPAESAIHAPMTGRIVGFQDNNNPRDYGPTIILEHRYSEGVFYSLYGHLSRKILDLHQLGDEVSKGQLLAWVGEPDENGGWSPHLHFQIMLDLLDHEHDFPGACRPSQWPVFNDICLNPYLLFNNAITNQTNQLSNQDIIDFRHQHLGKSLSLAYSEPIQMLRGDGVYLIDQFGQKYMDTCNNVAHVGHENIAVVTAGQQQSAVLNTNSRYLHPAIVAFTENLLATLPDELSVVHMVNSGSEANELALRMAKAYSGGEDMIAIESGYHGNSNANIAISSYKFDGKGGQGAPEKTHIVPLPDTFRGRHCDVDAAEKYAEYVQKHIDRLTAENKQVAAFIAESIISCGGQIELPKGYLQQVYQMVRTAGGLCIADEVQVGCGRIGSHFWAFEPHGVVPDIITIGKPIGNGHPMAVVVCTQAVATAFANGMEYFNTFGGNPVSATIGQAVLNEIKTKNLQQNAFKTGNHLKAKLTELQSQHAIIKDVRGQGFFLGFEMCDDQMNPLPKQAQYLADRMRDLGILISTDGPDYNVIKIKPPITFTQQHADELIIRLSTVLQENPMKY